jgi:hypothetical protein
MKQVGIVCDQQAALMNAIFRTRGSLKGFPNDLIFFKMCHVEKYMPELNYNIASR